MANVNRVKRGITKKFKRWGLSLKKESLSALLEESAECTEEGEFEQLLEALGEQLLSQKLSTPVITLDQIAPLISQIQNKADDVEPEDENLLSLENAFDAKRYRYKQVGKQFVPIPNGPIHGSAADLATVFVTRFELLLQRTLRHAIFRKSTLASATARRADRGSSDEDEENEDGDRSLTTTSELIGTRSRKCVFGMLCELQEGRIHLQDTAGTVQIDLRNLKQQTLGLFTFNCFVLCAGTMNMNTNLFEVESIGFPPYEVRRKTLSTFNNLSAVPLQRQQAVLQLEQTSEEDTFIFMSNVHLDDAATMAKLTAVFDGYANVDVPPTLFVLMGNFTARKLGSKPGDMKLLQSLFDSLCGLLLNRYRDTLCANCDFVFVPGPSDQLVGGVLPQPPLIYSLCRKFHEANERGDLHVHFQSNPFRIRFGTQEIVVFRQDLLQKMRRNCVVVPKVSESTDMTNHLCKTILDQAHLCPLPLQICPLYWNYSHALALYPSPHLVVLGDTAEGYKWKYEDSHVVCPGSFSTNDSWIVYRPCDKFVDFSRLS